MVKAIQRLVRQDSNSSLKDQDLSSPDLFECEYCSQTFGKRTKLNRHKREVHLQNSKMYTCTKCGAAFKRKEHYTRHMKAKHRNVRYKCYLCDSLYVEKNRLKDHYIKKHHFQICQKCGLLKPVIEVDSNHQCQVALNRNENPKKKSISEIIFDCKKCCKICFISEQDRDLHYQEVEEGLNKKKVKKMKQKQKVMSVGKQIFGQENNIKVQKKPLGKKGRLEVLPKLKKLDDQDYSISESTQCKESEINDSKDPCICQTSPRYLHFDIFQIIRQSRNLDPKFYTSERLQGKTLTKNNLGKYQTDKKTNKIYKKLRNRRKIKLNSLKDQTPHQKSSLLAKETKSSNKEDKNEETKPVLSQGIEEYFGNIYMNAPLVTRIVNRNSKIEIKHKHKEDNDNGNDFEDSIFSERVYKGEEEPLKRQKTSSVGFTRRQGASSILNREGESQDSEESSVQLNKMLHYQCQDMGQSDILINGVDKFISQYQFRGDRFDYNVQIDQCSYINEQNHTSIDSFC